MQSILLLPLVFLILPQDPPAEPEIIRAASQGKFAEADAMATKRIAANNKSASEYLLRAKVRDLADQLPGCIEDLTAALDCKVSNRDKAAIYNLRGTVYFKNAQIKESIDDFDAFLKMVPSAESNHWQRGIAYYYAKQFNDGRKQFEACEKNYGNDVENVVWRAMCIARKDGFDKSRTNMASVGFDQRVPMMTIYKLFKDEVKPEEVLKQAETPAKDAETAKLQRFYAHLYIGLYSEIKGDKAATKENLKKAVEMYSPPGNYMWAVARTHLKLLDKEP